MTTYHTYVVSCILFSIPIFSFDFNLLNLSFLEVKKKVTSHHASGLWSMISKIFSSVYIYFLDRTGRLTCILSLKKYFLWSNCTEYKRNVVWTTTKLRDKGIRISYLKNFKISSQIQSNFRRILAQAEFQCAYKTKPQRSNETKT